ncbi:MAG: tetratricopeptide repeat protein [Verrucomicrobia bacterium]|nr:tetratricopeptide repeat protein [Verrucomicrobiota bacterium]
MTNHDDICLQHLKEDAEAGSLFKWGWQDIHYNRDDPIPYRPESNWWKHESQEFFLVSELVKKVEPYLELIPQRLGKVCSFHYCHDCKKPVVTWDIHVPERDSSGKIVWRDENRNIVIEDDDEVDVFSFGKNIRNYKCLCHESRVENSNVSAVNKGNWEQCKLPQIENAYFEWHNQDYFRFFEQFLSYCSENKLCTCYWPQLSKKALDISNLAYDKMIDIIFDFELICEALDEVEDHPSLNFFRHLTFRNCHQVAKGLLTHTFFYSNYHQVNMDMNSFAKEITNCEFSSKHEIQKQIERLEPLSAVFINEIQPLFLDLYTECLHKHPHPKIFYERGMLRMHRGEYQEFLEDIRELIRLSEKDRYEDLLTSDLYLCEGSSYNEVGLYDQAVVSLTKAIQKNPQNKEAYFERAAAYFELGNFDQALQDYLQSGVKLKSGSGNWLDFSGGLMIGLKNGGALSLDQFLPSLYSSAKGLGGFLWATILHPIETPRQLGTDVGEFILLLKDCDKKELAQLLVPEMYDLVVTWDELSQKERGQKAGFCLGKYGTDILLPVATLKGVKYVNSYRKIRQTEKLCALETLAQSQQSKSELTQAAVKWDKQRREWFANVKIIADKQGKHIVNHKNFKVGNSEWTHPDPQGILNKHAGKGQKIKGIPGEGDYRERIDCGEIIGYFINDETKERIPTTMATIRYSKNGAHIVPAAPKK